MERFKASKDAFTLICDRIKSTLGLLVDQSDLKNDMRKAWAEAQERIHNGDWNIQHLASKYFKGPQPLVVFRESVFVGKIYQTVHESVFEENPHLVREECVVSGFEWLFRPFFRRSGMRGIFETDSDIIFPGFPSERLEFDRQALDRYLIAKVLIPIPKAFYSRIT